MPPIPDVGAAIGMLLSGNVKGALMLLLGFAVINYGAYVLAQASKYLRQVIDHLRGKANEMAILAATTIDDRFFDLLEKAVTNQAHLKEALTDVFADGKVTQEELMAIVEAIWADFKANTGVNDWKAFALALLGNASAPGAEAAVRAKFNANVHRLLGPVMNAASERTLQRRIRGLQVAREVIALKVTPPTGK